MYAMTSNNGDDAIIVDGNVGSDGDNEVLGAVSEAGMPMTKDDALIERVRAKTVEGLPIQPGSPWQGDVDVQAGDMPEKDDNDCDVVEQTNPIEMDNWDPARSIEPAAPTQDIVCMGGGSGDKMPSEVSHHC